MPCGILNVFLALHIGHVAMVMKIYLRKLKPCGHFFLTNNFYFLSTFQ